MDVVLALDLGTGSVKAVLADPLDLRPVATARQEYAVHAPHAGWAESDPGDWETAAAGAAARAMADAPDARVTAVGLSGQMHGVVLCDEAGTPRRPAVLWADGRATTALGAYLALGEERLCRLGNPVVPGMAGPTLHWLAEHEPRVLSAARWALQPKDWLRLRLTDEAGTEPSDASATLLWDVPADHWDELLARALLGRSDLLAPVAPSHEVAGVTNGALGLPAGVPVVHGGGDTACATYGAGLTAAGDAMLTVGTGAQIVTRVDAPTVDASGRTHLYRTAEEAGWYAMAAMQNAGLALERVWRLLGVTWGEAYALAARVPFGSAGLTFAPHLSGERTPYVDPALRGGWIGLGLHHERAHLVRSALEGVAFSVRQGLDALREAGHPLDALLLAGGGTLEASWRQLLADCLQVPLTASERSDASAIGAAALAARGLDASTAPPAQRPGARTEPDPAAAAAVADAYASFVSRTPVR